MLCVHRFRVTVIFLGSKGRETEVVLLVAAVQAEGWGVGHCGARGVGAFEKME